MHSVLFLSLLLTADAAVLQTLRPRALPSGCEETYEDIEMVEFNDGPTNSGVAGIGAEFETVYIQFSNNKCTDLEDTFAAKRKIVKGRSGTNFDLSVDTSVEQGAGKLSAEYVLDGRSIKVGDKGSAAAAGKAAYDSLASWKPWSENPANQVTIEDYPECPDPWTVHGLIEGKKLDGIYWAPQVTASMPLEALYSLMKENVQGAPNGRNILDGYLEGTRGQNLQLVTKDYFKALSLKMDTDKVNDAVLGFCTLVLSYAKAANIPVDKDDKNVIERSPKSFFPVMPRTEFVTIYKGVKSVFPPDDLLYDIFNTLACYKTDKDLKVSIDTDYCTGTLDAPKTGDKFGGLQYKYVGNYPKQGVPSTVSIKEWIQKIDAGNPSPDLLTTFDKNYDGSIGGLNTQVEKMYNQDKRTAPLFEFRDLEPLATPQFEDFMDKVDESIQTLHKDFAARPTRKVKRQNAACGILPTATAGGGKNLTSGPISTHPRTGTAPAKTRDPAVTCAYQDGTPENPEECRCTSKGTTTTVAPMKLSTVSIITQSCDYTTWPGNAPKVTQPPETVTTNFPGCEVCTVVGPNEDDCFPLPSSLGCTVQSKSTVLSGDTSGVTAGTLTGSALFSAITSGIDGVCQVPPNKGGGTGSFTCTESAVATIASDIHYVSDEGGEKSWDFKGELELQITEASYDSLVWYESAKAVIAAYAQNSTQGNCRDMTADEVTNDSASPPNPHAVTINICNVGSHFQLVEFDPTNKGTARELSFELKFQRDTSEDYFCKFLEDVVEFIEVAVNVETDTEAAIPEEIKVDEKLLEACEGSSDKRRR